MRRELLEFLQKITPEEQAILDGGGDIRQELYTSQRAFVVDSRRLLETGRLIEIRPHTRFAHFPRHRHNYVEMVYQCAGGASHLMDRGGQRETVLLEAGDLLFLNQNVSHEILPTGRDDLAVNFIILPQFFSRPISMIERENVLRDFLLAALSGGVDGTGWLHIRARGLVPVENLLESMIWTLLDRQGGTNTILETSLGLLFMNLSMYAGLIGRDGSGQGEQSLVFAALKYIEDRYSDGTLAELARQLRQPEYHVSRLLKKYTGSNFKELLQQRKLQQAAYLLEHTPLPVETILTYIGYDNSSYFYRRFRLRYGCSPKAYRSACPSRG
ncbi:MAG: AraC family transcriptional regulator [Oscillospiraceae bacterium]|nr:AraC family transcriptional regulator [Oscillospiraceae bacterium]